MSSRRQDRKGKAAKEGTSPLPGHRKTNPNPKATATSKSKSRKGKKNIKKRELTDYEVCKMYGWESIMDLDPKTFAKPEPAWKRDKEPWKSYLAWDKESIEELERKNGKEGTDRWVYNEEEVLEFDKRCAKHFNWTDEDWEYADECRKNCKEFWADLDFDTYWSGLCHDPECLGLSSHNHKPERPRKSPQYLDGVLVIEDECSDSE